MQIEEVDVSGLVDRVVGNLLPAGFDVLLHGLEANIAIAGQDLCDNEYRLRANVLQLHENRTCKVRRDDLDKLSSTIVEETQLVIAERDTWFEQVFKLPQLDT